MKRFYKIAEATPDGQILLDGRAVRTPTRAALLVPSPRLAEAIAAEWAEQGETIEPRSMPLTGLANAAVDRVATDREAFIDSLAGYAETDLLCYRADHPEDLVRAQAAAWDPLLDWAAKRYDIAFETTAGIVHAAQPPATLDRLRAALAARGDFELVALQPLVTISGSLVVALALAEGAVDVDAAWAAGHLDELYQVEHWGEDELAAQARAARRADFDAAARFLSLL